MLSRLVALVLVLAGMTLAGAPVRADDLQVELRAAVERYYAALRAGDLDGWLAASSAGLREQAATAFASEEERQAFLDWQKQATPSSFEVKHAEAGADETRATLYTVAALKRPPESEGGEWIDAQSEIAVDLVKEADGWKVESLTYGADPAAIQRADDDSYEPIEAYDTDVASNLGGRIVRVEFKDDHTLLVVRLMDEEDFVYLPARAELEAAGFDPNLLVPEALVEIDGHPHRSDKFKIWATGINIL